MSKLNAQGVSGKAKGKGKPINFSRPKTPREKAKEALKQTPFEKMTRAQKDDLLLVVLEELNIIDEST